jgi:pimeloyl-ACP methyl ester carboxylesterase
VSCHLDLEKKGRKEHMSSIYKSAIYKSEDGERLVLERYREFLKYWPVPHEQRRVPTTQGETFVIVSGPEEAPPLLLFHGGAANSAMWMGEISAFARLFRVYAIDMIGEPGLSAPSRPSLASDAYAMWLDDVLNHLSIARASVVGISLGGWLAFDYAIRRPARVEKIAALCPGGIGRQKVGIVFRTLVSRMFGKRGKRWLTERILGRPPADPPPAAKVFIAFVALIYRHFRPRMVRLPKFSDRALRDLRIPVLAIVGGRDVLLDSAQTNRRLKEHVPEAQVVYLPDAGHLIVGQTSKVLDFLVQVNQKEASEPCRPAPMKEVT